MSNFITASVEFYFKGEKHGAYIELDMDQHMLANGELPDLYPLLASAMNIGPYSYEYEMMLAETILFSDAKGLIADYVNDGILDLATFNIAWSDASIIERLQEVAQRELSINDLLQHPGLKNALLEAYRLGRKEKDI